MGSGRGSGFTAGQTQTQVEGEDRRFGLPGVSGCREQPRTRTHTLTGKGVKAGGVRGCGRDEPPIPCP